MFSVGIACAIAFPTAAPMSVGAFDDISGHWAEYDITYLYNAGMVSGISETEFAPDAVVNRAEFVTMLVRALGIETDVYSISFSDVSPIDDWFAGYLGGAVNAGIISDSKQPFNPTLEIPRSEVALMLNKAIAYSNKDVTLKACAFSDISEENAELYEAVKMVYSAGIMFGKTDTEFCPDDTLTRAEAAAIVKRISVFSEATESVSLMLTSGELSEATEEDGVISFDSAFSYAKLSPVDFHFGMNMFEVSAAVADSDLRLEVWLDSLDTLTGTKIASLMLEKTASADSFTTQSASINRVSGNHEVYLRLIGDGSAKIKNASFKIDEVGIDLSSYSKIYGMQRKGQKLTNLKRGGYVNYDVSLGDGYDSIEFTMINSKAGQLFEIFLGDDKVAVLETKDSGESGTTVSVPVVKAHGAKTVSIKPVTDVDGAITGIRFYNSITKGDLLLDADSAETELALAKSSDYDGANETEAIQDGDVIKFSNVNFSDGYNFLSMRMRKCDEIAGFGLAKDGESVGLLMGSMIDTGDDDAYIEVRLDSEDGKMIGKLSENPVYVNSEYDTQSCELYGATGTHDLYLKAVGNVNWSMKNIKLQERGWYDSPFRTYEAEDMAVYKGTVTDPNSAERYLGVSGESSGRANVLIEENGGYVEFTVPEWYEGKTDRTALNVRYSITDYIDEAGNSVGQKGKMKISVNGEEVKLLDSFNEFKEMDYLTLSNEYSIGYSVKSGGGNSHAYVEDGLSRFLLDDSFGILPGDIKPGDVIRLEPEINDSVTYCYIDCIEIETIEEAKEKPERFLSITDCGAIPNDGVDDGEALRAAVAKVNENPYTYDGVWIPEGSFDMIKYVGASNCTAADFSGIRVLGSGIWTSRLINHRHEGTNWAANYTVNNTVIRDLSFHGQTIARGWNSYGAICLNGKGMNHVNNVWIEHYNCAAWIANGSGVWERVRMKNTWADGINHHQTSDGIVYTKSFGRANGDDPFVIYSSSSTENGVKVINLVQDVQIKNVTAHSTWHASSITIWGGKDIDIMNNLIRDASAGAGISLNAWGWGTCGTEDVWATHNRIERSGNLTYDGQATGPLSIVPGTMQEGCNNKYMDTYFECNEFIDNPYLLMRVSSQGGSDEVLFDMNYNYARNSCLAITDNTKKRLIEYRNAATHGELDYFYNVYEGDYYKWKTSHTEDVKENFVGNLPEQWGN